MSSYAEKHGELEFHRVGDRLFITDVKQPEKQLSMNVEAVDGLMGYLATVGLISGRVQVIGKLKGGTLVYRAALEDRRNLEDTVSFDIAVYEGEAEEVGPVGFFGPANEGGEE